MRGIGRYLNLKDRLQLERGLARLVRAVKASEEGAAIIEMAVGCTVLFTLLIGIVQVSQAFYIYNFVSAAAREGTRYASVRGVNSCTNATNTMPDCNLSKNSSGNPIQTYLQGLGFPYSNGITATPTWLSPTGPAGGPYNQWTTPCMTATDTSTGPLNGDACNSPGHAVQVQVTYSYPLAVPFWGKTTLNISSTSQMIINE
jgi:hypothetical protein